MQTQRRAGVPLTESLVDLLRHGRSVDAWLVAEQGPPADEAQLPKWHVVHSAILSCCVRDEEAAAARAAACARGLSEPAADAAIGQTLAQGAYWSLAATAFARVLAVEPCHLEALEGRALCAQRLGDVQRADAHWQQASAVGPLSLEAQRTWGESQLLRGACGAATLTFVSICRAHPTLLWPRCALAEALARQGETQAAQQLSAAIDREVKLACRRMAPPRGVEKVLDVSAREHLAAAALHVGDDKRCIDLLSPLLHAEPQRLSRLLLMAQAFDNRHEQAAAARVYRRIATLQPTLRLAFERGSELFLAQNKVAAAAWLLIGALKGAFADDVRMCRRYAQLPVVNHGGPSVEEILRRAVALRPDDPALRHELEKHQHSLGRSRAQVSPSPPGLAPPPQNTAWPKPAKPRTVPGQTTVQMRRRNLQGRPLQPSAANGPLAASLPQATDVHHAAALPWGAPHLYWLWTYGPPCAAAPPAPAPWVLYASPPCVPQSQVPQPPRAPAGGHSCMQVSPEQGGRCARPLGAPAAAAT